MYRILECKEFFFSGFVLIKLNPTISEMTHDIKDIAILTYSMKLKSCSEYID